MKEIIQNMAFYYEWTKRFVSKLIRLLINVSWIKFSITTKIILSKTSLDKRSTGDPSSNKKDSKMVSSSHPQNGVVIELHIEMLHIARTSIVKRCGMVFILRQILQDVHIQTHYRSN